MKKVKSAKYQTVEARSERNETEKGGTKRLYLFSLALLMSLLAGTAHAQYGQYPVLDAATNRVIQKYQNSSCDQLWQDRYQPKSQDQQRAVDFLRSDPQIRRMFIDRVAAPVANKLFEFGMIP